MPLCQPSDASTPVLLFLLLFYSPNITYISRWWEWNSARVLKYVSDCAGEEVHVSDCAGVEEYVSDCAGAEVHVSDCVSK